MNKNLSSKVLSASSNRTLTQEMKPEAVDTPFDGFRPTKFSFEYIAYLFLLIFVVLKNELCSIFLSDHPLRYLTLKSSF